MCLLIVSRFFCKFVWFFFYFLNFLQKIGHVENEHSQLDYVSYFELLNVVRVVIFFLVSFLIAAVGDDKSSGFFNVTIFFLNTLREWSFSFFINDQKNHTHRSRRRRWWWNFKKRVIYGKTVFLLFGLCLFQSFSKA